MSDRELYSSLFPKTIGCKLTIDLAFYVPAIFPTSALLI